MIASALTLRGLLFLAIGTVASTSAWNVTFVEKSVLIHMAETRCVNFTAPVTEAEIATGVISASTTRDSVVTVGKLPVLIAADVNESIWNSCLNVTGIFLGNADIVMSISSSEGNESSDPLPVVVIRPQRTIDTIFTASVAILVSVLYINFGCAMDWDLCRRTLKRPIGPAIGIVCHSIWMPVLSYFIGLLLFPDDPEMRIGMFFTGVSPAGGASNLWTVILGGNLNLSVTMTTVTTFASFVIMPFWIFTLGKTIFHSAKLGVPYAKIGMFATLLILPLGIGYAIQKKLPRVSRILARILKPVSSLLIIFIIVFAVVTNLYLFKLFSWRIVVAGIGLPWLGYLFGFIVALVLKQPGPDIMAISIETGIQNTGIAIFLLRFSLLQPAADLTTVAPVAVAIMTPVPLTILWILKSIRDRRKAAINGGRKSSVDGSEKLYQGSASSAPTIAARAESIRDEP